MVPESYLTKIITKESIPWLILALFFSVISFILTPLMQEGSTFLDHLIFFGYLAGTLILARKIYVTHYKKVSPNLNFHTLAYIPILLTYMVGVEVSANTYRLFEPGFLYSHLKYHIFDDTPVIIVISLIMWGVFQRFRAGKETFITSYILGVIFQSFFADKGGYGTFAGLLTGFVWIWIFHFAWLYTSLLIRKNS